MESNPKEINGVGFAFEFDFASVSTAKSVRVVSVYEHSFCPCHIPERSVSVFLGGNVKIIVNSKLRNLGSFYEENT